MIEHVKTNKYRLLLILLILIQLIRVVYVFNFEKEGYHSDEVWCYGLANSYYDPFIFSNGSCFDFGEYDCRQNFNEWLDGSVYRDYIEVGEDERFAYDSVIYNQSKDRLPPFHYILLHTVCSLFPNTYSMWYGLSINLLMLVLTNIFLYRLANKMFNNEYKSLLTIILYGFGIGALQTFMYIRMYATVTFFIVLLTYLHAKMIFDLKYKAGMWIALCITTAMGALTQYVFIFYAFFLAAFICIFFLLKRKIKRLIFYASAMLSGIGIMLLIFPYAINQLFGNNANKAMPIPSRLEVAFVINRVFMENLGIYTPVFHTVDTIYIEAIVLLLFIFAAAAFFILRRDTWVKCLFKSLKKDLLNACRSIKRFKNRRYYFCAVLLISSFAEMLSVAYTCDSISMGLLTNRYLFCVYPLFCLLISGFLYWLLQKGTNKKNATIIMSVVTLIFVLLSNLRNENCYLFPQEKSGRTIDEISADSDLIIAVSMDWLLVTLPDKVKDANKVFNFNLAEYESMPLYLKQLPDDGKDAYLIFDVSLIEKMEKEREDSSASYFMGLKVPEGSEYDIQTEVPYDFEGIMKQISEVEGVKNIEYVGEELVFTRKHVIYRLR